MTSDDLKEVTELALGKGIPGRRNGMCKCHEARRGVRVTGARGSQGLRSGLYSEGGEKPQEALVQAGTTSDCWRSPPGCLLEGRLLASRLGEGRGATILLVTRGQ